MGIVKRRITMIEWVPYDGDGAIVLGDAAGVNKTRVQNVNRVDVKTVDSLGNFWVAGGISAGGVGMLLTEQAVKPGTPAAGSGRVYSKTDGKVYYENSAGREFLLSDAGGLPMADYVIDDAGDTSAALTATVDASSGVSVTCTFAGVSNTIGDPTGITANRKFWVMNLASSTENATFNGIVIEPGHIQGFQWDGAAWGQLASVDAANITYIANGYVTANNAQAAFDGFMPAAVKVAEANRALVPDADLDVSNLRNVDITGIFTIVNNVWKRAVDFAGTGFVNMFKINASDEIEVGAKLNGTSANFTGNLVVAGGISAAPYYGVTWNETTDVYARTGALSGEAIGASPSAFMPIQEAMKRCVLDDSGNVLYFLDPDDSTLKDNGQPATITDQSHGQVMVQIPKFWYKYSYSAPSHTWEIASQPVEGFTVHPAFIKDGQEVDFRYVGAYEASLYDATAGAMVASADIVTSLYAAGDILCSISGQFPKVNETRAEFRGAASQRGAGWREMDFDLMSAAQLLYLTEYADFDSQTTIGEGRTALSGGSWVADSYIGQAGKSNSDGNGSASVGGNSNTAYMTYRGIENFFGNVWTFIDGVNIYNNEAGAYSRLFACNNEANFADDTQTNYEEVGDLALLDEYQSTLSQVMRGFLPLTVGATSSTKITDYFYTYYDNLGSGWVEDYRVLLLGGAAVSGSAAGVFCVSANGASSTDGVDLGGRLCF